jgi:hypothetical protein
VKGWIDKINESFAKGLNGPQSIAAGIDEITKSTTTFGRNLDLAQKAWTEIKGCADTAAAEQKGYYEAAALSDQTSRIQQLSALTKATKQLSDLLEKQYANADKWMGPNLTDYVISDEISLSFDKMQNVTVKVASVTLKVDSPSSALSTDQQAAGSATFSVRRYSSFTPEIGVGAVFGTIKQPTYGTGKNAEGQTVVAKAPDKSLSINPTILANFVCRCGTGLLVPMVQVGAAVSKDLPSILVGGGLRLFGMGKGDIAIGGGGMFAWYKDLQKLKVGDVISGTNDINADLGYLSRPKIGGYFAIQYKF